jgi:predicted metal-binding membrane protein
MALPLFILAWLLMVAAMMLPTTTSLMQTFGTVARRREDGSRLIVLVVTGFGLVWLTIGLTFRAGDVLVHTMVESVAWLDARPQLVGATLLMVAGGYELSSLKHRCLTRCRTPRGLIIRRWGASSPPADALGIGIAYGWSCVGCCWALMLLMFGLASANPAWMLIIGGFMAVEKNTSVTRYLSIAVGVTLLITGALVAIGLVGAPAVGG